MTTYAQWLKRMPPACACEACKNDCAMPCWGTPDEMRKLIDAGYGARLMLDWMTELPGVFILVPALKGYEGKEAPARAYSEAGCTFWTDDKLCALHESGLKPLEGKLSHHHPLLSSGKQVRKWIAAQWNTPEGQTVVEQWKTQFMNRKEQS